MAIRREFRNLKQEREFRKVNHLVRASKPVAVVHASYYPTKKTPKELIEVK